MSLASDSAAKSEFGGGDFAMIPGPGSIIADKYRIERKIGKGGMGVVVAARHVQLNQMVAIKFLRTSSSDKRGEARFMREARAAAALQSENVARVHDVGTLESGAPYIVMEYLEGMSLSKLIRRRAPLPVAEAVDLMLQACRAMNEAHALGIVHRDIKPGNMFVAMRPDGTSILKVLDFGISKTPKLDADEPTLTATEMVLGSPKYLSPEQVRDSKSVDHRSDVWSLGLVLYYMLCGKRPFEGETMSAVCVSIATQTPESLISLRHDIPPALNDIVMQCLVKDREERVQSAADLARAIAPFASSVTRQSSIESMPSLPSLPADVLAQIDAQNPPAANLVGVGVSDDSRRMALALPAAKPAVPMVWIQGGAALAVVGVVAAVLLTWGNKPAPNHSPIVTPAAQTTATATAAAPPDTQPAERDILIPGDGARPMPTTRKTSSKYDIPPGLLRSGMVGTAQVGLRLLTEAGGTQVIGVVPKGEIVVVKKVFGEWALVTYVNDNHRAVSGWTIRNLIQ